MKKLFLFLIPILTGLSNAQTLTSKDGEPILPEAKDWGISIDATKFIKNVNFEYITNAQTISGKYFLDEKTAIRAGLRLGFNNWTSKAFVLDRGKVLTSNAYPNTNPLKENTWRRSTTAVGLSAGIEKRRGKTRLQGVYGAEAGLYFSNTKDKFTYGNALNATPGIKGGAVDSTDDAMSSPVFGKANNIDKNPNIQGVTGYARMVERSSGVFITFLMRAFIGVEYFVLPKMSVGGEFGWGPSFNLSGRSETIYESIGISTVPGSSSLPAVRRTTIDGNQNRSFKLDNDNTNSLGGVSASLRLNLYF